MKLPWIGDSVGSAADSAKVDFDIYRAEVVWLDGPMQVEIIELGEFALIGMTLLQDTRLTMDIFDGGTVQIAPLPTTASDD